MELKRKTNCTAVIMRKYMIVFVVGSLVLSTFLGCKEKPVKVERNIQYVSGQDELTYLKLGKEITDSVGLTLKSNLVEQLKSNPINAVQFCNQKALELTDVYSTKYNTIVKRGSNGNRNQLNAPNELEAKMLDDFQKKIADGEKVTPRVVIDQEGRKNYYAPIYTGGVCLTCHGNVKNMQPELVQVIDSLYPNDKAKGYGANELRGIWTVKFKNS